MKTARPGGRYASLRRPLLVLADLLRGLEHDRHSIASRAGVELAAADRIMHVLGECVPGVVDQRDRRARKLRFDPAFLGEQPDYPVAIAACFGGSLASLFDGSAYSDGMRSALEYVVARSRRRKSFADWDRKFVFVRQGGEPSLDDPAGAERFDDLVEALLHQKRARIRYRDFEGRARSWSIEPLSIAIYDHQLYAIARVERAEVRLFRLARIEALDLEPARFVYPPRSEYEPRRLFQHSLGVFVGEGHPVADVVIRLQPAWAHYASTHRWHPSQQVVPDGEGVLLKLHVRLDPELESLILGFGESAEVLAPPALRKRIAKRLERANRVYRKKKAR